MKPVDPRLLRYARATRGFLAASVLLGLAGAGLVVAQAMLIAETVVRAFQDGASAGALRGPLLLLALVACGRALVAWLTELAAHRCSASVKSELRIRLLERATASGRPAGGTGELTALATRGVDALDDYFARYLPQLGLAAVVPAAVLVRIVTADWVSALVIALTLPLVPLFMVLIGWATQAATGRRWRQLSLLSGHFLDVVAGLPTLKVFGRAKAQAESIRRITADYRRATMRTLRIAFLSSFALELLSTISVALVAVGIGMRLVHGELDLYTGLVVLVLAPEAYLPLRQVGAHYHAAAEGLAAAERAFEVIETPLPSWGGRPAPRGAGFAVDGLAVRYEGRAGDALPPTDLAVAPGETVALTGRSGAGKSTLLAAVLGFVRPAEGRVLVGGVDLAGLDPSSWRSQIAWVPQRPVLFAGTIAENVRLARRDATDAQVLAALADAEASDLDPFFALGEDGAGLSAGQRQRVALARAFLADRPVLLMDEPTAALDGATEAAVVAAVRRLAVGRTVLLVAHRVALVGVADRVVRIGGVEPPPMVPAGARAGAGAGAGTVLGAPSEAARGVGSARGPLCPPVPPSGRPSRPKRGASSGVRGASGVRSRLVLAGALGTLALASAVGLMATSGWLISRASQQPPILYLMVAVTATRAFGISRAALRYAERLVSHDAVLRLLADVRVTVYRRLERIAPAGLRKTRRGDLLTRLVADVDTLQDRYLRWRLPAASAAAVSAAAVAFTAWLLPEAGLALAAGLIAAGVVAPLAAAAVSHRTERRLAPLHGALATQVVTLLSATPELTVAGALPHHLEGVRTTDAALTGAARRSAAGQALAGGLTALASGLTVAAATALGVQAVHDGRLGGVWLACVVLTPLAAFEGVAGMPLAVRQRGRVHRAQQRLDEVLAAPVPAAEGAGEPPANPFPLTLDRVTARYPGAERPALDGVGLTLREGERIAVVGPSGSGKTTLAQILLRFLDPVSGRYSLGGYDADAVRRHVGLCAQDAHLFDSSLRENLKLARPAATGAELHAALAAARLDDWAATLPQGLDTPVGEHGTALSGGQRQRLALARALLADFPVLVLDEPAEHLDLPTADALTADLLAATRGRTTVLITHRLEGLDAVDEILVLEAGRIAQRGTYAELAAAPGPFREAVVRERAGERLAGSALPSLTPAQG